MNVFAVWLCFLQVFLAWKGDLYIFSNQKNEWQLGYCSHKILHAYFFSVSISLAICIIIIYPAESINCFLSVSTRDSKKKEDLFMKILNLEMNLRSWSLLTQRSTGKNETGEKENLVYKNMYLTFKICAILSNFTCKPLDKYLSQISIKRKIPMKTY